MLLILSSHRSIVTLVIANFNCQQNLIAVRVANKIATRCCCNKLPKKIARVKSALYTRHLECICIVILNIK